MSGAERTREAARVYFEAWRDRDFALLRTVLAEDVEFSGVFGDAHGIDECIAGLQGMASSVMDTVELTRRVVEDADAMTWFDLIGTNGARVPTVNWSRVENGLITRIRVVFDPRPLT
ncbi:nuclear transport factor 2 family protein [uncultured Microbacterium sp.]|uniref:nuclear transport factor 2 family protein n=1 Tax=uncultured Microbacterium sp. TaxID=191216 RepID=UPI0025DDDA3C|nr:nuclear transport factor 2 family protein [uncultured Microbacterium sp.]